MKHSIRAALLLLLSALGAWADPITAVTGWIRQSATTVASDLGYVLLIVAGLSGFLKGWVAGLASIVLAIVVVIWINNPQTIMNWAKTISLS